MINYRILTTEVRFEQDIVLARQRARQIASLLGFETQEQTRIATAVSEIARNAFKYASGGKVEFFVEGQSPQMFLARVSDSGSGITDLQAVLSESYCSETGMGLGIVGARRLMDEVQIDSTPGRGTTVKLLKQLPKNTPPLTNTELTQLSSNLLRQAPQDPYTEIQQQNQELLQTLAELRQRQEELAQLNQELEDTNRGVIALYAELNDKAESLQQVSELKTRFLSNMSHEFRTPLNAIISLSNMLLAQVDGDLSPEQEKQVTFIHKSAESLSELVNDFLDLAKVEAGKVSVQVAPFEVEDLFSALRGMMRPLVAQNHAVSLIFEETIAMTTLHTDETKVSQILRNFISNALKYTERGEVRVTVNRESDRTIVFSVTDTGIGIATNDQTRIFEEFAQIENPLQKCYKGTGLGLSLCKKLAELLGGKIHLQSSLGVGSTFSLTLPINYSGATEEYFELPQASNNGSTISSISDLNPHQECNWGLPPKILIIDDQESFRYLLKSLLSQINCTAIEAANGIEGLYQARWQQPQAIFLDILMPEMTGFEVLQQLKSDQKTSDIPVIVMTSKHLEISEYNYLTAKTVAILAKENTVHYDALIQIKTALEKVCLNLPINNNS